MMDGRRASLCSDLNSQGAQHSTAQHSVEQFCYSTAAVQPAPASACMVSNWKGLAGTAGELENKEETNNRGGLLLLFYF